MSQLAGKKAVVLGAAAARGSGGTIARQLVEAGCDVVIGDVRTQLLNEYAGLIGAIDVPCDATDEAQVKRLADTALERMGRVDIAINAAGAPLRATIADATREQMQQQLDLNYFAHVFFIRHMARVMQRDGSITVVTSMAGTCVTDGTVFPYSCAKAAANCLVQCAAIEYGPRNIRVNAILPGAIESDASRGLFDNPRLRHAFEKEVPLGRIAQPEDIANAALWLAGPAFATGLLLQINGGNFLTRFPTPAEVGGGKAYDLRPRTTVQHLT
mgnify:CR=1 FL=1